MRRIIYVVFIFMTACNTKTSHQTPEANKELGDLLENYYQERMQLFPLESTRNGDTRYNDKMYADFTDDYRTKLKDFYQRNLDNLHKFKRDDLNKNDQLSYDYLNEYLNLLLNNLSFRANLIPTDQMWGNHLMIGQWGSGEGSQPFKTVKDYDNWLQRLYGFITWMDSAIVYFKKGIAEKYTLPQPLVKSMIPQFEYMVTKDASSNLYFGPVKKMPDDFSEADRNRITEEYTSMIVNRLIPAYDRMAQFLKGEYLPKARTTTTGLSALPGGNEYYKLLVQFQTTTNKTPEEIRATGISEVARIRNEMEKIKDSVQFKGTLEEFFKHLNNDPKFTPYKEPEEVLNAFRSMNARIEPNLRKMFSNFPKTPFEIRRTEAFREKTASAEYIKSPDGIKPAIFYVPIPDVNKYNITGGMESLFLHEAIPGHHYQISLQLENKELPKVRRYDEFSNTYVEGWALYAESLGRDLGLYTDPYQYFGSLGDEMHRAIRLVVDVDLHTGKMTREEAIKYMMANEQISEQGATAEIERYISGPAQALGYKMGALKIVELRNKYQQQLGDKFSLTAFHDELLKDGSLPLTVTEQKMDRWAESF